MRNCKYFFLSLLLIFISCSKEDEINELNETIISLQSEIINLNSEINDYAFQINELISQNNIQSVSYTHLTLPTTVSV